MVRALSVALLTLALFLAFPAESFAYIDAGTGSLILQSLLAVAAAAFVFLKYKADFVKRLFRNLMDAVSRRQTK